MRLLFVFMVLFPTIASANYPITYNIAGNQVYDSTGASILITKEAIIDDDGFTFIFNEEITLEK